MLPDCFVSSAVLLLWLLLLPLPPPQVKVLVDEGKARLDVKSRNGNTPLDAAHLASASAVVAYLESRVRGVATGRGVGAACTPGIVSGWQGVHTCSMYAMCAAPHRCVWAFVHGPNRH
jgi:ankyrin repeat protein